MIEKESIENDKSSKEVKIGFIELIEVLWAGRKIIIKTMISFIVLGLLIAFTSSEEYDTYSKLLHENRNDNSSVKGFSSLAGLAGIDLGGATANTNNLSPLLYPEIVSSLPVLLDVINDSIYFEKLNVNTTPYHYFKELGGKPSLLNVLFKVTIGLPGTIKRLLSSGENEFKVRPNDYYRLSKEDWKLLASFRERISVEVDESSGIITIVTRMPDPYASAQLAEKIELKITEAVVKYKTEKLQESLEFIVNMRDEKKKEYEDVQNKMARIMDRNQNVSSASARVDLKRIEHDFELAFEVFKGLSQQVEEAKILLEKQTPVFSILNPIRVPEDKSAPRRGFILMLCVVISVLLSCGYIVTKMVVYKVKAHMLREDI